MSHSAQNKGLSKDPLGSSTPAAQSKDTDWVWDQFAELLDQAEMLAKEASSPIDFYKQILSELVSGFAAKSGRVWSIISTENTSRPSPRLLCQVGNAPIESERAVYEKLLGESLNKFEAETVKVGNQNVTVVAVPGSNKHKSTASLIEIVQRSDAPAEVYETTARLLEAVAGVAMLLHMRLANELVGSQLRFQAKLLGLAQCVAGDMRTGPTAYRIVNECRQLLKTDRVSLLEIRRNNPRLLATSQIEKVDQRSKTVGDLTEFARLVAHQKQGYAWSIDEVTVPGIAFPEEYQELLDRYSDDKHVRSVMLAPMFAPTDVSSEVSEETELKLLGVLIAESFHANDENSSLDQLTLAAQACAPAFDAALKTPLASLQNKLRWWMNPSHLMLSAFAIALVVTSLIVACVFQVEHTVTLRGHVLPVSQAELYAPTDSQVIAVNVLSGQKVNSGEALIKLQDSRSLIELQRLAGELLSLERQLEAIDASRLSLDRNNTSTDEILRLTSEHERLALEVKSTKAMIQLVEAERALLTVRSPLDGLVSTWQVDQLLENRPVQRGQQLLSVVDTKSGWKIELETPDDRLGIIRDAQVASDGKLVVKYQLASEPNLIRQGTLSQLSSTIEQPKEENGRPFALAEVEAKELNEITDASEVSLVGVSVTAEVHCGKKSLAEVALYDVWRFLKTKWELGW